MTREVPGRSKFVVSAPLDWADSPSSLPDVKVKKWVLPVFLTSKLKPMSFPNEMKGMLVRFMVLDVRVAPSIVV